MSYLESLFTKYGTDKGVWGYTPIYERYLAKQRLRVKRVLEIGICGFRDIPNNVVGASLFAWRDFFPNAEIYGLDNDPRFIFNDQERIHTRLCDAYDPVSLSAALASFGDGQFDFVVDDAVHDPVPQFALMRMIFPSLKVSGIYAVEELCPYKIIAERTELCRYLLPLGATLANHEFCPSNAPFELGGGTKPERVLLTGR